MTIGSYNANIFHIVQPVEPNSKQADEVCNKCLEPGHFSKNGTNEWKCKVYMKPGHKMIDCPQSLSEEMINDDSMQEEYITNNTVDTQAGDHSISDDSDDSDDYTDKTVNKI